MVHFTPPPRLQSIDYTLLRVTQQSCYLCLTAHHAPQVSSFLHQELPDVHTIVDGTAHIGCDTLNFAIVYPNAQITAIDIDVTAFECLESNIKTFFPHEYQQARFSLVRDDFLKVIRTPELKPVDLVYLDPPWGGPDYYKKQRLMLYLSDVPIFTVINEIFTRQLCKYVLLKVPKNFDVIEFTSQISFRNWIKFFSVLKINNRIAFTLLLIKRSDSS